MTSKTLGYAHDFCNMKVRGNQNQFFCIAHSFFGLDMFFSAERNSTFGMGNERLKHWQKWTDKH